MTLTAIPSEFLLIPHHKGMQLIAPEKTACLSGVRVGDILQAPMNVYFHQMGGVMLECSEQVLLTHYYDSFGYYSHQELRGVNLSKLGKAEYIQRIKNHDQKTLENGGLSVFEDEVVRHDGVSASMLTFKFPCFFDTSQFPIIFGISVSMDTTLSATAATLSTGLPILLASGLISRFAAPGAHNYFSSQEIDGVYLTDKQIQCVNLALKGMTAKKIGAALGISFRTVEGHFENLKHKLKAQSKSELLEKIIYHQQKKLLNQR